MEARRFWLLGVVAALLVALWLVLLWPPGDTSGAPGDSAGGAVIPPLPGEPPLPGTSAGPVVAETSPVPGALWRVADAAAEADAPAYKEVVRDRVLVRLSDVAGRWRVGDQITIPIPQLGQVYNPVVERIERAPGGNQSLIGTLLENAGQRYRFVVTVGPKHTFAHLGTPQGSYELVANTELGWLMPTANMDQHVDYSKPDYFIPEDRRRVAGRGDDH